MVRSSKEAMEAADRQVRNAKGMCQRDTRTWFDAPSAGDVDGDGDFDAYDGWLKEPAKYRHAGDRNPPAGKPLSFKGGSNKNGHRCISWGGRKARSTDMKDGNYKATYVGFATIEEIEQAMGVQYLGWSETIDGQLIPPDPVPRPVPPKPGVVSGDVVLATNNLMSNPRNKRIELTLAATSPASVVGLQELDPIAFKKAAEAVPNFDLVDIPAGTTYACGINFNETIWELKGSKYVKEYDGASKISYTRHMCIARLYHKRLQFEAIAISFHAVTQGNDKKRSAMRALGLKQLRAQIRQYKKEGVIVFVMGDYNSTQVQHPTASIKLLNGIDHIYVFNGKKTKAKKKRTRKVNTPSDHDAFIGRIAIENKL